MAYSVSIEEFPSLVREFASYKSAIQNSSEKTVSEYLLDLRTFFRYLLAKDKKICYYIKRFGRSSCIRYDNERLIKRR